MKTIVGVVRGNDKFVSFDQLLTLTGFDTTLTAAHEQSKKDKRDFSIVIKPNMMVYINPRGHTAVVTDKELVEHLVDHVRAMGFSAIAVCEAQHDVGRMLKNHTVAFIADRIGYDPRGRYRIVDLSLELRPFVYTYTTQRGGIGKWKDTVGVTWRDADFRISFAKCKTHEHDWMTLSVKNIYGCFPATNKIERYHMKSEIWTVTGYAIRNFPVHFAFVDAWIASDGFQGYKIPHPKDLRMLFGGPNAVAVDMEIFKRCGLYNKDKETDRERYRSKILHHAVEQLYNGAYPEIEVRGDTATLFKDATGWDNISNVIVKDINKWEEIYMAWGLINLKVSADGVDYGMFPPKNILFRMLTWASRFVFRIFSLLPFYRKLYHMN